MIELPAISMWQPWASLVFTDRRDKRHETRAYPPPAKHVGRRIALHAAKHMPHEDDLPLSLRFLIERNWGGEWRSILPRGAVIGTAVLKRADPTSAGLCAAQPADVVDYQCGDWTPGRWAWLLDDVEKLVAPIPWKGKQGWFTVQLP